MTIPPPPSLLPPPQAPPIVFPPIPPKERRQLRVLGLFDGIGTGKVVLDDLGFAISKYVSCEIDLEAINVCRVNHQNVVHVGDIRELTEVEVRMWGTCTLDFDLCSNEEWCTITYCLCVVGEVMGTF